MGQCHTKTVHDIGGNGAENATIATCDPVTPRRVTSGSATGPLTLRQMQVHRQPLREHVQSDGKRIGDDSPIAVLSSLPPKGRRRVRHFR